MLVVLQPVDLYDDLSGQENGRIDLALTVIVHPQGKDSWHGGDRLHRIAARKWAALVWYAAQVGITLSYSGCGRTFERQDQMFDERYIPEPSPGVRPPNTKADRRYWAGRYWWLDARFASAAVPGTSNHGWYRAVDMAQGWKLGTSGKLTYVRALTTGEVAKLTSPVLDCGWSWEMQSENWHIRDVTGDLIPQAVLDYEATLNPQPPQPPPIVARKECDMIVLDYRPGTPQWTRLVTTGTHLAHVNGHANETYSRVFTRLYGEDQTRWPVDVLSRDGLLAWLAGSRIDSGEPCPPELYDDPTVVAAWVAAGGKP